MRTQLALSLVLSASLSLGLLGCSGTSEEGEGSYNLGVYDSADKQTYSYIGESVSCKANTSFPASDSRSGKFFVGVTSDQNNSPLSATFHFLKHTSAPPAGDYTVGEDVTATIIYDNSANEAQFSGGFDASTLKVTGEAPDIRVILSTGFDNVSGTITCPAQ